MNAITVDRGSLGRDTLERVLRLLRDGGALLIFPEGTRSLDGKIRDARPGVGMMATAAGVPVVPAYVRGTRRLGRAIFRRGSLGVFFGDPILPEEIEGANRKERRRRIGEEVTGRIRALQSIYG